MTLQADELVLTDKLTICCAVSISWTYWLNCAYFHLIAAVIMVVSYGHFVPTLSRSFVQHGGRL
jgi:hypothetical protein